MENLNALLNLIQQDNNIIDKIYLYAKDLEEPKYQFLIKKKENKQGLKVFMIKVHLLNIQILWMVFTIILIITMHKEK